MASTSLSQRIMAFFRSPQGRRIVDQGRRQASRPENQQKLRGLLARLRRR